MASLRSLALAELEESKAIPYHPAFAGGAPISTYIPGGRSPRKRGELSQSEAHRHLQAYGGSEAIDWVSDCINLYADSASSAPWHLETQDGNLVENPPEQLTDLLTRPNPFMDYIELIQLLTIDLLLVGNAYWYKWRSDEAGRPLALYRLSPKQVRVVPGPYGVKGYIYQPEGETNKLAIKPQDVIHFKRPNPHGPWYGQGVIKEGGRALDTELSLTDSVAHFFENKADPSLIIESERRAPRDVLRKLRRSLRERASGTPRSGELLLLEAGLKAKTLDRSARDAMYSELGTASRDRILAMFRVSPKLLGLVEAGGGQDKVQDSRREFDNKVMRPFLDKIQSRVTMNLTAAWDYNFVIDYKYIMPPEELVKLTSDLGSVPGIMVKEVRQFLVEGGIIRQQTTGDEKIDELVLNLPGEEHDEDGQPVEGEDAFADRSLPREAGRPPLGENTRAIPRGDEELPPGTRARRKALGSSNDLTFALGRLRDIKQLEGKAQRKTTDQPDTLRADREAQIDAIVEEAAAEIAREITSLERTVLDHVEGKAFNPKSLAKRIRESSAWQSFSERLAAILESVSRQAASLAAMHQTDQSGENVPLDYEAIVRRVVYRPEGVEAVSRNLQEALVDKVSKALEEGASRQEVNAVVREALDFWRVDHGRVVALTDATHAYNEATLTALEARGHKAVAVFDGQDHDLPCAEANGQVWTISEARNRRVEHPRCRRAFSALVDVS